MKQQPKDKDTTSAWFTRLNLLVLLAMVLAVVLITAGIVAGYYYEGTGFGTYTNEAKEVVPSKTLWDWLELLIVPATLFVGGYLLNKAQRLREEEIAKQRTKEDRAIAEQRIKEDREIAKQRTQEEQEIAEQRTQETALQTYLDQMGKFLIENKLSSAPEPETKDVARIWTLTIVRRVNPERKGIVLRFLLESKLIQGDSPIVSLIGAALGGVNLGEADLGEADLREADLREAALAEVALTKATLRGVNLSDADLRHADLRGADLRMAHLINADLRGADLRMARLGEAALYMAHLSRANLEGATYTKETIWPDGFDPVKAGAILVGSP